MADKWNMPECENDKEIARLREENEHLAAQIDIIAKWFLKTDDGRLIKDRSLRQMQRGA